MRQTVNAVALVAVLFLSACSHKTYLKQRDYISPEYLGPKPPLETKEKTSPTLSRFLKDDDYLLSARPLTEAVLVATAEDVAFKEQLDAKEKKARLDFSRSLGKQGCFSVVIDADKEDAANLAYFSFVLESQGARTKLKPHLPLEKPVMANNVGSYSTGGYGYSIGDTYYYTPTRTHVYNYATYSSSNIFCARKPVAFEKGVTLLVEPRYKRDLPVDDLVWSVDPKDKETYAMTVGMPFHPALPDGKKWLEQRYQENRKKTLAE